MQSNLEQSQALLHDGMWLAHGLGELGRSVDVGDRDHIVETEQDVASDVARLQEGQAADFTHSVQFHHVLELGADAVVVLYHVALQNQTLVGMLK